MTSLHCLLVIFLLLCSTSTGFFSVFHGGKTGYRSILRNDHTNARANRLSATEESKKEDVDETEKLAEMMKLIVNAVQEGREEDLLAAGLKVTRKTARETLDEKLSDPQINQNILGSMTSEEEEMMKQLSDQVAADMEELSSSANDRSSSTSSSSGSGSSVDLDPFIFAELQAEARDTLYSLRSSGSGMAALLDDGPSSGKGFGAPRRGQHDEFGDLNGVLDNVMGPRSPSSSGSGSGSRSRATTSSAWSPAVGAEQELPFGDNQNSGDAVKSPWSAVGPPAVAPGSRLEVEEAVEEEEEEGGDRPSAVSNELPISQPHADSNPVAAAPGSPPPGATDAEIDAQETFAQLLKATMEQQTDAATALLGDMPDDMVRGTVDAIAQGDIAALDMKALLGEALSTLTDQLGIDMKAELQNSPQSMGEIQGLMVANMADLAKNMEELDKESQVLYDQLGSLEADLRRETAAFDEQKQMELGELLESQNQLQDEFSKSKAKLQVSTAQLEGMMKSLEEDADALTALALFPIKPVDKKIAFIVGLALVFKVPFNLSQLVAVGSTDLFSDMLTILTQSALCLVCLNHYGLLSALGKKSNTIGMPPPPENL